MINLLGRLGRIDQAVNLIKSMPHEPDFLMWSTFLSVTATKIDFANTEMAARHLFELDPRYAVPYVMLSNMYASVGTWKDVASVRTLVKTEQECREVYWVQLD